MQYRLHLSCGLITDERERSASHHIHHIHTVTTKLTTIATMTSLRGVHRGEDERNDHQSGDASAERTHDDARPKASRTDKYFLF